MHFKTSFLHVWSFLSATNTTVEEKIGVSLSLLLRDQISLNNSHICKLVNISGRPFEMLFWDVPAFPYMTVNQALTSVN